MEKSHMGMGDGDGGLRQNRYMGCNVYRMEVHGGGKDRLRRLGKMMS
jgi:hypothetical protein